MTGSEAFNHSDPVRDVRTGIAFIGKRCGPVYHPSRYLRGWVTEAGIRRYVLAPIPGSFTHSALVNALLEVR